MASIESPRSKPVYDLQGRPSMTRGRNLRNSRVLVTGGAGTIGSHVVDHLVAEDAAEIIVLDNFVRGRRENLTAAVSAGGSRVRVVEGDIRDRGLLDRLSAGSDVVFHLAAIRITQCAIEPQLAQEVMVDGTFNVLAAAAEAGVGKVILSSSASVYGLADTFPTPETQHPYNNDTLYGAAKAYNEGAARSFHAMSDLDYVALRYFNVYGPRMDAHGKYTEVLIRWMERIASGEPPLILGNGNQTMDFVHVADIARANILAAQSDATDEVFNIAGGEETSLADLARALCAAMGREDLIPEHGPERSVNSVPRRLADITAASRRLGWKPEIDLADGLRGLVDWWTGLAVQDAR